MRHKNQEDRQQTERPQENASDHFVVTRIFLICHLLSDSIAICSVFRLLAHDVFVAESADSCLGPSRLDPHSNLEQ